VLVVVNDEPTIRDNEIPKMVASDVMRNHEKCGGVRDSIR
jgi:hypothetical protein